MKGGAVGAGYPDDISSRVATPLSLKSRDHERSMENPTTTSTAGMNLSGINLGNIFFVSLMKNMVNRLPVPNTNEIQFTFGHAVNR